MSYKRKAQVLAKLIALGVTIAHFGKKQLHCPASHAKQSLCLSHCFVSPWCHLPSQRCNFDTGLTLWLNPLQYLLIRELAIEIRALSEILSFLSVFAVTSPFYSCSWPRLVAPNASQSYQVWLFLAACCAQWWFAQRQGHSQPYRLASWLCSM